MLKNQELFKLDQSKRANNVVGVTFLVGLSHYDLHDIYYVMKTKCLPK